MRSFLLLCVCLLIIFLGVDYLYYNAGVYIPSRSDEISVNAKVLGKDMYLRVDENFEKFEIKGVDIGASIPGHFSTDYATTKNDYLRWFKMISDMGANTIRIYTMLGPEFYQALYEHNTQNTDPLYLIHGLWVNDYVINSHRDAYDKKILATMIEDSRVLVDVIHGNRKASLGKGNASGFYKYDISQWVIGYILGVEWEEDTIAFTDHIQDDKNAYTGKYMYSSPEATPFEAALTQVGDKIIEYETKRYAQQRLVAFANWPSTDPFDYEFENLPYFSKIAKVNVEHIKLTDKVMSGTFASYHIYPYYPDYLAYEAETATYVDETGNINTYRAYMKKLNDYHTMPVVVSEFGIPTSRGIARKDNFSNRNQGHVSEKQQGQLLVDSYNDIKAAGCSGAILFSWQDEWFKTSWNTIHSVDRLKTPNWSDFQTNDQFFGLLTFDPGKEKSVSYVDGDISEWQKEDIVLKQNDTTLSMKYDEKFVYLMLQDPKLSDKDKLYIPIDTTPKTGAEKCDNYGLSFDRAADFVIAIDGRANSRVVVQERYDVFRAMFSQETYNLDPYESPPHTDGTVFNNIYLSLQSFVLKNTEQTLNQETDKIMYETGKLIYGNANPNSEYFNSIADFCYGENSIEIRLPWQLLNFSNPSEMLIHDDYYINYGVDEIKINKIYLGLVFESDKLQTVNLSSSDLKGWGQNPTYHERLKSSYYDMQKIWKTTKE